VMQGLLELGFLQRLLQPQPQKGSFSNEYAHLLGHLLESDSASVNLKASICRQIIAAKDADQGITLSRGLLSLMRGAGLFLATYCCAALVNLSQAQEVVKNYLMNEGIAETCLHQLKSHDDDLILYTLMLLVHLSKRAHHRAVLVHIGLVQVLQDLFFACYGVLQHKLRLVTELCSVLGQMCNEDATRKYVSDNYQVIECLFNIFETSVSSDRRPGDTYPPNATKIISKVLFVLKQLCAGSMTLKDQIGSKVIRDVVMDLRNPQNLEQRDWATNTLTLLQTLSQSRHNVKILTEDDCNWISTWKALTASPLGSMDATRDKIGHIHKRYIEHNATPR